MSEIQRIVLAIDAGGSSTRCVVVSGDGTVLGAGRGGPANHILNGWDTACASVRTATGEALQTAGVLADAVGAAVIGSAGVGPNGEGREPVEEFLATLVPRAAVRTTGDMVTAFWGALREPVGVVVSAGTGSVCFGRNRRGATCQVGGWGPVMGDEGSAYDIATQALRAVARAADGRAPHTELITALAAALGGQTALEIAIRVYGDPLNREQIAALALPVATAARDGDVVAAAIVQHAGEELGLAAVAAMRQLDLLDAPVAVSFAGAVFDAGELVLAPFRATVRTAAPEARVTAPLLPVVGGAARLAIEALGTTADDAVIERLRASLARSGA